MKKINHEEYIGKKYGFLTIIDYKLFNKDCVNENGKDRSIYKYICKCDCGTLKAISRHNLLGGRTKSCGCYKKTKENKTLIENARKMGLRNRKYPEKCTFCGKEEHYAKGLCHNCYNRKLNTGKLEYTYQKKPKKHSLTKEEREIMSNIVISNQHFLKSILKKDILCKVKKRKSNLSTKNIKLVAEKLNIDLYELYNIDKEKYFI